MSLHSMMLLHSRMGCRWLMPGRPYGKGRITLCGDGSSPMTPNLGQGGCVALEVPALSLPPDSRAAQMRALVPLLLEGIGTSAVLLSCKYGVLIEEAQSERLLQCGQNPYA